jgi:hypothetical protein
MLTFLDTEKNTNLKEFRCDDNKLEIEMSGNRYNLGELKGFDILRTSDWTNAEFEGGTLFVENVENLVTYSYECGKDVTAKFTLIPLKSDMGDINSDGASDASDASMILAEYADISTGGTGDFSVNQKKYADVNSDAVIDSSDASIVLAYYGYTSTGGGYTIEEFIMSVKQ